jgi:hypothetical protein
VLRTICERREAALDSKPGAEGIAAAMLRVSDNPTVLLFLVNLLLLLIGKFLYAGPAILIRASARADLRRDRGASRALRAGHVHQPDPRAGYATDGPGAVRHFVGLWRAHREHRARHAAFPRGEIVILLLVTFILR